MSHADEPDRTCSSRAPRPRPWRQRRHLRINEPGAQPRNYELSGAEGELLIGRLGNNVDIELADDLVSRRHAKLRWNQAGTFLLDLGSKHGTQINGLKIKNAPYPLNSGDEFDVGDTEIEYFCPAFRLVDLEDESILTLIEAFKAGRPFKLSHGGLIVADQKMFEAYTQIAKLAKSELTVLISGETGVGKEIAATVLHAWSARKRGPLRSVNSAVFSDSLIESTLFGHERGAFTGALCRKVGEFELADGGTLFLDEVGELSLEAQAKLLRVLGTSTFTRVGGTQEQTVNVRVIAATNRDLNMEINKGRFREDLYFRLNVAQVTIPPLRDRTSEIILLIRHFTKIACDGYKRNQLMPSNETLKILQSYSWPGNVRELKNCIARLAVLVDEPIILPRHVAQHFPAAMQGNDDASFAVQQSTELEADESAKSYANFKQESIIKKGDLAIKALTTTGGRVSKAAELVGVSRSTFYRMRQRKGVGKSD